LSTIGTAGLTLPVIPDQYAWVLGATGMSQALAIVASSMGTRFILQTIPFVRSVFDPTTGLFFVTARETCAVYYAYDQKFITGEAYTGGGQSRPRDQKNFGALRAIDPVTGQMKWEFRYTSVSASGVLSTASGLVFAGDGDGNIMAFDSRTGKNLWHYQLGVAMRSTAGTTYMLDGKQYLLVPSGSMLTAFALPAAQR